MGFGAFLVQLLGYLVAVDLFRVLSAVVLVFGSFALVRRLTRRTRQRGGSPK